MVANIDVILINDSNSKTFLFRGVASFRPNKIQPPIVIPLVNTVAGSAFIFRFVGQSETVTFTFALFDDGVDVAQGTHTSTVKTIAEQIQYLKDDIFTHEFDTVWILSDVAEAVYPDSITGVITNLDFDLKRGANTVVTGTMLFQRGAIASL